LIYAGALSVIEDRPLHALAILAGWRAVAASSAPLIESASAASGATSRDIAQTDRDAVKFAIGNNRESVHVQTG
jgi:hypothetical protein